MEMFGSMAVGTEWVCLPRWAAATIEFGSHPASASGAVPGWGL